MQKVKLVIKVFVLQIFAISCHSQDIYLSVSKALTSKQKILIAKEKGRIDWLNYNFEEFLKTDGCLLGLKSINLDLNLKDIEKIKERIKAFEYTSSEWNESFLTRINKNKKDTETHIMTPAIIIEELGLAFIGLGSKESSQFVYVYRKDKNTWMELCIVTLYMY